MNRKRWDSSVIWGILLIVAGVLFIFDNFNFFDLGDFIRTFWPLILVAFGINYLLKSRQRYSSSGSTETGDSESRFNGIPLHENNVFGDISRKFDGQQIENYSVSNVFGDVTLDCTHAGFEKNSRMNVSGVFGDIEIILPSKLNLRINTNSTAGTIRVFEEKQDGLFKNLSYQSAKTFKTYENLELNVTIVFGDIRIHY